jgi:hypothetical protein
MYCIAGPASIGRSKLALAAVAAARWHFRCLAYKAALYCRSKMIPVRMVWLAAIRYGRPAPTRSVHFRAHGCAGME